MYAALGTHQDIAFAITALSRYNSNPLTMHLTAWSIFLRFCSGDSYPMLCAQRNDEGEGFLMLWS
jgi:hypothetical protein